MPTYDYQCDACDHKFELYQGINDEKKKKCPECGKLKLRRLMGTGAAIVFKGSGFYQTDYRSESYNKAKAADSSGESKAGESKPGDGKASDGKSSDKKSDAGKAGGADSKASAARKSSDKSAGGASGTSA